MFLRHLTDSAFLLSLTRSQGIMRRYFVVNGFDGALTMLGLIMGFWLAGSEEEGVLLKTCLGAAIALGVSGVSSAWITESAEGKRALDRLEDAMITDLQDTAHGHASRWVPLLVALVNGLAPLFISMLIVAPLWWSVAGLPLPLPATHAAMLMALALVFSLGVFLGRVAGTPWLRSGLQTMMVALLTVALIYLFAS